MLKPLVLRWLWAVLLVCCLAPSAWADGFALQIDDVSGLDEPWPLIAGLPFPEGALRDSGRIRIVDAQGATLPAQVDVAATWRDGSIRWALAGFTASPQGAYRVEFGAHSDSARAASARETTPLQLEQRDGLLLVDTGAAVYEFLPDRLLPEHARMGTAWVIAGSGDGAYLVDNRGRLARVAGAGAEVKTEIVKQGPERAVVRREGWYVTEDGQRLARSVAWFYFAAGSPALRVTHSLIFTEDTNEIWVQDYGLELRSARTPRYAVFPLGEAGQPAEALKSMQPVEIAGLFTAEPDGGEVFMLQDAFPHFLEREARAVVGRAFPGSRDPYYETLETVPAVGDWADARFDTHGLTVVMPWLAQRFPKEIAFGPDGARVAFWSGRSGRELDFRAATLVDEYWQDWADRAGEGREALAAVPSNAQGAARTHDVWILPRSLGDDPRTVARRAKAASRPPLVLADPAWLAATEATGWPMHPVDPERFPREEAVLSDFWDTLMDRYEDLRRTGFIAWGAPPHITGFQFFRVFGQVDYGLRRHVWGLYARSGERRYLDYGTRFNRFMGDWSVTHHPAPGKFVGGFATGRQLTDRPLYWGTESTLRPIGTGHDIAHWLLEHYLTGDERSLELTRLHGEAFTDHWEEAARSRHRDGTTPLLLRVLADLYAREWVAAFGEMARELADYVIDLDSPNGISDGMRFGALYKVDQRLISLYYYYRETGDERAREAFLRGVDYKYRFNRVSGAFSGQAYPGFLFAVAYGWTGDPNYLRVLHALADEHRRWDGRADIISQMNPTMGLPAMLGVLAELEEAATTFPVLRQYGVPRGAKILFRKPAERPVAMRIHLRLADDLDEDAATTAVVSRHGPEGGGSQVEGLDLESEAMFRTRYDGRRDPRRRAVSLSVPAQAPAGLYTLEFPGAEYVDVLDTDAPEIAVYAPEGHRLEGPRKIDHFRVAEDADTLRLFLGVPTEVRRPDGSVALSAQSDHIGEQEIPVRGDGGVWSLVPEQSGIVRLFNAEPLFAREPEWLVTGVDVEPAPRFEPPSPKRAFVPGRGEQQALHLPDAERLRFARGGETADGYAHFPGSEGTVEFWFRPNWSSVDLAYTIGRRFNDHYFLRAGSHDLQYRRGQRRPGNPEFAALNLWAFSEASSAGFTGKYWFKAGEWYHLAFNWRTIEGEPGHDGTYAVFVNGEPVAQDHFRFSPPYWPGGQTGNLPFQRRDADERITIGPVDGTIAQLRISSKIRYESDFEPPPDLPAPDAHTRVQFALDGDYTGETASGGRVKLAR